MDRSLDVRKLLLELIRFGGVGGFTTVLYFALLWLLAALLPLPMWLLAALASGPPLLAGYVLHRSFTFHSEKQHGSAGPRFLFIQLAGVAINSAVIWLGTDVMHAPFLLTQLGAIGVQVVFTYLGQKFFAFS